MFTDRRLSLYAAWFENRFRQYPEVRNRGLSSGGLAIAGLEPAAAEALLALPDRREEINRRLDAAFSRLETAFFAPEASQQRAERYENAVSALLNGLETVKSAAERGAKTADQALRRGLNPSEQRKILAALDEITKSITGSEVKEVAGFLFPPGEAAEADKNGGKDGADLFRSYLKNSARLFHSLAEAAGFNLDVLLELER